MASMNRIQTFAAVSIAVGIVVLALKYIAYVLTGSVALLSDAIESVVNVATAVVALLAIRWSAMPADAEHPYGHHKAEYFSAVVEGVLIVVAALLILREAYFGFQSPKPLDAPWQGLAVNGVASLMNAAWSWVARPTGAAAEIAGVPRSGSRSRGCTGHPVVGLGSDEGVAGRTYGRSGPARDAGSHPRNHFGQCRWRYRGS